MKKLPWILTFLLIITLYTCSTASAKAGETKAKTITADYFPLKAGWQWRYNYVSETQDKDGNASVQTASGPMKVKKITAVTKTVIASVSENESAIIAAASGNELNLDQNPQGKSDYYFVLAKASGTFWQGPKSIQKDFAEKKLTVPQNDPMMILPLKVGQHWGDVGAAPRQDTWYRWQVETEETIKVPAGSFKCFRLAYRSCPDHQIIWFSPGVGIVKQEYRHHGTVINISMELISYGLKK